MTIIMAHRGSSGTHPENTLAAIKAAVNAGADSIEIDVQLTKDNVPIVMHDKNVNRMTNGKGLIHDFTYKEIKKLKIKQSRWKDLLTPMRIPSFQEVLTLLKENELLLNIELKTDEFDYPGIEEIVLELCKKNKGHLNFVFSSFNSETLKRVREQDKDAALALIMKRDFKSLIELRKTIDLEAVHPSKHVLGNKELGDMKVRYWTVNSPSEIKKYILAGAEGIITDYPQRAIKIRSELFK